MATLTNSQQGSGAAAAQSTILLTFAQTAGRLLELLVRGSANASATIAAVIDNSKGSPAVGNGSTTTVIVLSATSYATNELVGAIAHFSSGVNAGTIRTITANTSTSITVAAVSLPSTGDVIDIGNVWAAVPGQAWTADGGAGTSHAQWWQASGIFAAGTSVTTITVVWAGGNTANTLTVYEFSGFDTTTPSASTTAAAGNSATPTCNSISPSGSGYLLAGYSCPTTAQTWSSALDNAAGNAMTITQPSGTSRAAGPTLVKASGGTFAPRITMSTSEGWVAIPLYINDAAGAATHSVPMTPRQVRFFPRRRVV